MVIIHSFVRYLSFNISLGTFAKANIQSLTSMRHLPEKVIFTEAARPRGISLLRVNKSSCLPKLKSITVLIYNF